MKSLDQIASLMTYHLPGEFEVYPDFELGSLIVRSKRTGRRECVMESHLYSDREIRHRTGTNNVVILTVIEASEVLRLRDLSEEMQKGTPEGPLIEDGPMRGLPEWAANFIREWRPMAGSMSAA